MRKDEDPTSHDKEQGRNRCKLKLYVLDKAHHRQRYHHACRSLSRQPRAPGGIEASDTYQVTVRE